MPYLTGLFLLLMIIFPPPSSFANDDGDNPAPNLNTGARVYSQRCILCHGKAAMGEGILPIKLKTYPNTSLIAPKYKNERKNIYNAVVFGGTTGELSNLMPPMGNNLTWTETESVVDFVLLLRKDHQQAMALLKKLPTKAQASTKIGQQIFSSHCALCHGSYGEGNGRMAKVIKSPPPADLTASRLPDIYLKKIISSGGPGVGRSPQMPPWGDQLDKTELESIILYLKRIRD